MDNILKMSKKDMYVCMECNFHDGTSTYNENKHSKHQLLKFQSEKNKY